MQCMFYIQLNMIWVTKFLLFDYKIMFFSVFGQLHRPIKFKLYDKDPFFSKMHRFMILKKMWIDELKSSYNPLLPRTEIFAPCKIIEKEFRYAENYSEWFNRFSAKGNENPKIIENSRRWNHKYAFAIWHLRLLSASPIHKWKQNELDLFCFCCFVHFEKLLCATTIN